MKDCPLLVLLLPVFVFVFLLGGWVADKPLLPPVFASPIVNNVKIWQDRIMGDGSYMSRSKAPGGWVVFVSKKTDAVDGGVAVGLLFVPDVEHVWIFR